MMAVPIRAAVVAFGVIMGPVPIVAGTAVTAAMATLAFTVMRPATGASFCLLWGWMSPRLAGAAVGRRDRHADEPLDIAQIGAFLVIAERNCHTVGASARGATDAVDIALGDVWQIVVDHVAYTVDVDRKSVV